MPILPDKLVPVHHVLPHTLQISAVICLHKSPLAPPPMMNAFFPREIPNASNVFFECSKDNDTPSNTLLVKCALVCVARIHCTGKDATIFICIPFYHSCRKRSMKYISGAIGIYCFYLKCGISLYTCQVSIFINATFCSHAPFINDATFLATVVSKTTCFLYSKFL